MNRKQKVRISSAFFLAVISFAAMPLASLSNGSVFAAELTCLDYGGTMIANVSDLQPNGCPSTKPARNKNVPVLPGHHCCVTQAQSDKIDADAATNTSTAPTSSTISGAASGTAASPGAASSSSVLNSGGFSGLIPCGGRGEDGAPNEPCTACHAVVGAKRLMDYLTSIMVIVAIAVIVAMGVLYILSGVNADLKKTAKGGLTAVLIGLVLMLSAWLIVSTILSYTVKKEFIDGGGKGFIGLMPGDGAYGLQCVTSSAGGKGKL